MMACLSSRLIHIRAQVETAPLLLSDHLFFPRWKQHRLVLYLVSFLHWGIIIESNGGRSLVGVLIQNVAGLSCTLLFFRLKRDRVQYALHLACDTVEVFVLLIQSSIQLGIYIFNQPLKVANHSRLKHAQLSQEPIGQRLGLCLGLGLGLGLLL